MQQLSIEMVSEWVGLISCARSGPIKFHIALWQRELSLELEILPLGSMTVEFTECPSGCCSGCWPAKRADTCFMTLRWPNKSKRNRITKGVRGRERECVCVCGDITLKKNNKYFKKRRQTPEMMSQRAATWQRFGPHQTRTKLKDTEEVDKPDDDGRKS